MYTCIQVWQVYREGRGAFLNSGNFKLYIAGCKIEDNAWILVNCYCELGREFILFFIEGIILIDSSRYKTVSFLAYGLLLKWI